MPDAGERERPAEPEDLGRLFLQRAGAGDVDGVVALYEPGAVLAAPGGALAAGTDAIRAVYQARCWPAAVQRRGPAGSPPRRPRPDVHPVPGRCDGRDRPAAARWRLAVGR